MRIAMKLPLMLASQRFHFSCGAFFFSSSTALQRDRLQHVELAGAQRRVLGGLVLDHAVGDLVDEGQLVLLAADGLLVPVDRVLAEGERVALHVRSAWKGPVPFTFFQLPAPRRPLPWA
jgi:hypothetical protein